MQKRLYKSDDKKICGVCGGNSEQREQVGQFHVGFPQRLAMSG